MIARAAILAGCAALVGCGNAASPALVLGGGSSSSSSSSSSSGAGGGGDGAPATSPAEQYFETQLFPSLDATCGGCHGHGQVGPQFLGADAVSAYHAIKTFGAIITDPKQSRLLTKGQHSGPALSGDQASRATLWLGLELKDVKPGSQPPPELTPLQQLEKFGHCMKKADWDATNVARLAKATAVNQNNNVPCASCHGGGQNGTFIDADGVKMLAATQKMPFLLKLASATLKEDGTFHDIAFANRWVEKGTEGCPPIGNCHPKFTLNTQLVADINTLFTLTYGHWQKDECGP